jgi:hypothetical protein
LKRNGKCFSKENESVDKEREKVEENYCKNDLNPEDKERSTDAIYVHSRLLS